MFIPFSHFSHCFLLVLNPIRAFFWQAIQALYTHPWNQQSKRPTKYQECNLPHRLPLLS